MNDKNSRLRELPAVDRVLNKLGDLIELHGHELVTGAVRTELAQLREELSDNTHDNEQEYLGLVVSRVNKQMEVLSRRSFIPVFNLSGTVLHTNLGRALLPDSALDAIQAVSNSASNLEYDLEEGKRGDRDSHIEQLLCELSGAEAVTVVNNNAAAVLLTLNTLGKNKEVPVSRGELVEIGGSFRMPEIISSSGCQLIEVGTTNRTHLKDYRAAINNNTGLLLKVHTSNYRIEGFVSEVKERELAQLANQYELPFVIDLGSGNLIDFKDYDLPDEPTVKQTLDSGADLVTFSGDKLLGGPQCGIIAGKKTLINDIKSNPLKRALRIDKMTLAALTEVLRLYQNPSQLKYNLPTLSFLTRSLDSIREQAERISAELAAAIPSSFSVETIACMSQVGSGALPAANIPSYGLAINTDDNSVQNLWLFAQAMRQLPTPVIGRIHKGSYLLDLRCLTKEDRFVSQLSKLELS